MSYSRERRIPGDDHVEYQIVGRYRLAKVLRVKLPLLGYTAQVVEAHNGQHPLIDLRPDGWLTLYAGFQWDGASGAKDTPSNMRASAVHDALCTLVALDKLPRRTLDQAGHIYGLICLDDGMPRWRAIYHEWATRRLASPTPREYRRVYVAP